MRDGGWRGNPNLCLILSGSSPRTSAKSVPATRLNLFACSGFDPKLESEAAGDPRIRLVGVADLLG